MTIKWATRWELSTNQLKFCECLEMCLTFHEKFPDFMFHAQAWKISNEERFGSGKDFPIHRYQNMIYLNMMPVIIINRSWLQAAGFFSALAGVLAKIWPGNLRHFPSKHWFYVVHCFCFLQKSSLVNYKFTAVFRIDIHLLLKYFGERCSSLNLL